MSFSPKLRAWFHQAFLEKRIKKYKQKKDYAIFPESLKKKVDKISKQKTINFLFVGSFVFNIRPKISLQNRKWVIGFAKKHFDEASYFCNTSKGLQLTKGWNKLGNYDKTYSTAVKFFVPKFHPQKKRNQFDKKYYEKMCASKFSLCPAGDKLWSMRFYESLLCRTIPIVNRKEETYRTEAESKIDYKFYYTTDKLVYREDWVEHNYNLFVKYHTLSETALSYQDYESIDTEANALLS